MYIFCFAFSEEKKRTLKKKQLVQISYRLLSYKFTGVSFTRIRIHVCRDFVHLDSLSPLKCLVPTPGLTSSTPCAVFVCVCVRIHTNTITYSPSLPPASKIDKTKDNTSISPSVKNVPPRQATSALHRLVEPYHPRHRTRMNKLCIRDRMCTPCSDCVADMHSNVKNTCGIYTPACTGAQDTCLVHTTLTAKMHIHPRKHVRAAVQQPLRHANHCSPSCKLNLNLPKKPSESSIIQSRQSMAQPQLCCHTGIIWSSALVRAPSGLFIVCIRHWPPWKSSSSFLFFFSFSLSSFQSSDWIRKLLRTWYLWLRCRWQ